MTSRKLFLTDCRENFKRRNWVFWLQFLAYFVSFPGALILGLNNVQRGYAYDPTQMMRRLDSFTKQVLNLNLWISALIVGLAVLVGIQGFSWLHDKKQVNFYHSQPVSRGRRFLVIWFNGIAGFLVAYLINLVLGLGVASSYGCLSAEVLAQIPQAILGHLLLFLSIYHVAIVAVMLTGYTLVSLMGTVVLLAYEVGLRAIINEYAQQFFYTYSSWESENILNPFFSPLILFFRYQVNRYNGPYSRLHYSYSESMFTMAGLVLLYGILGWLLYKHRASESHGKSISFSKVKEPLRVLLLLVMGTLGGLFVYSVSGSSEVLGIAGAIFVTIIGHGVIQLIYEVDFKAIRKNLPGLGISVLLVTAFFVFFRWDLMGYDDKIPDKDKVESLALVLEDRYWDGRRVLPDGTEVSIDNYLYTELKLKDVDLVYQLLDNRISYEGYGSGQNNNVSGMEVVFRLKNGKTRYRVLYIDKDDNLEVLNEIFHSEEYQKVTSQVMEDDFVDNFRIFQAEYDNGRMNYALPAEQVRALVEAYVKDVQNADFSELYYGIPIGRLTIGGEGIQNPKYVNEWRVAIYPGFDHTCALLRQEGILPQAVCDEDYLASIRSVSLYYYEDTGSTQITGPEAVEMAREIVKKRILLVKEDSGLTREDYEEDTALAGFYPVEEVRLKEVLDSSYLQEMDSVDQYRYETGEEVYEVIVEQYTGQPSSTGGEAYADTKTDYGEGYYSDHYFLQADQVPEFLKQMGVFPE
ncbi:MAG: hypothetical protein IJP31_12125 [Lachnospiraceae bacterium]|nr:hypothetical protein [Lachnospiraceae bacterium]